MKHCLDCGYVGPSEQYAPGKRLTEVRLWFFFLVPGMIYSLWRFFARYDGCANCASQRIVPVDSPVAQAALRKLSPTPSAQSWYCMACGKPIFGGGNFCSSCVTTANGES